MSQTGFPRKERDSGTEIRVQDACRVRNVSRERVEQNPGRSLRSAALTGAQEVGWLSQVVSC